jgi:hypothetical protein
MFTARNFGDEVAKRTQGPGHCLLEEACQQRLSGLK